MTKGPILIESSNLSLAWLDAMAEITAPGVEEISPLIVSVDLPEEENSREIAVITRGLDEALAAATKRSSRDVANTIFPLHQWRRDLPGDALYSRYSAIRRRQRRGGRSPSPTYFERLISFGSTDGGRNQLKYIIDTYRNGNHRRSALQASLLDPDKDQTNQRQKGFPCLQQIAFTPHGEGTDLTVTGFYATQYLFERAYGNYVGLCRVGDFVAHELGFRLARMVCLTAVAKLGESITKTDARNLLGRLRTLSDPSAAVVGHADGAP